jgi:alpha-beta hydrolase superfamily lysophospholipase
VSGFTVRPTACLLALLVTTAFWVSAAPVQAEPSPPEAATTSAEPPRRSVTYRWPVTGAVARSFDAPATSYGPGHRGVDLPVTAGQPVHPMADGLVVFAGSVAGTVWLTVLHDDGVRTSYGPLEPLTHARQGTWVVASEPLGRARGDAHGRAGLLHVGARIGERYIDPASLVAGSPRRVATLVGAGEQTVPQGPAVARPVLVPGTPPSPNRLIVLPGLTSRTGKVAFDLGSLGYGAGTWEQFSYLGVDDDGNPLAYGPEATWERVHDLALALRDQLRVHAREHPGQAVDLMGHSLGGLVAMYYLLVLHDATDPSLPPIGRIATVASPLQGTDSADVAARLVDNPLGKGLLSLLEALLPVDSVTGQKRLSVDMPVLEDLRTGSDVAAAIADAWERHLDDPYASPLATGTQVLTLASLWDPVVIADRARLPGADGQTFVDWPWLAHDSITTDPRAEEFLVSFLAREPLPDPGLGGHLANLSTWAGGRIAAGIEHSLANALLQVGRGGLPAGWP